MDELYITLPSNVRSVYFENTSANYKTKLAQTLDLQDYEVGMAEISYSLRFYNVPYDEEIVVKLAEGNILVEHSFLIKQGNYSIEELIATLNRNFKLREYDVLFDLIKFKLNRILQLMVIDECEITISQNICAILGFDKCIFPKGEHLAPLNYDIMGRFHTLFVYCDIIKPNLVGDSQTPLLRYVEIPNRNYGDQVHIKFPNIHYFPLITNELESIEIDIKDDTGKNIPFHGAENFVVLHFRKSNKSN